MAERPQPRRLIAVDARLANFNTSDVHPLYHRMLFSSLASGDEVAEIVGGNLEFKDDAPPLKLEITLKRNLDTGHEQAIIGYSWDNTSTSPTHELGRVPISREQHVFEATIPRGGKVLRLFATNETFLLLEQLEASNGKVISLEDILIAPGWPPIQAAPVPPSAPGINQPIFGSGSATHPPTPQQITGHPIIPPPPIGQDKPTPIFPPPTPPPIGVVPVGDLVGPAVKPANVPPSLAGVEQPQFGTGSKTAPTAASWFPDFTTHPPYPPIVVHTAPGIFGLFTGHQPPITPPETETDIIIRLNGWGPPGPQEPDEPDEPDENGPHGTEPEPTYTPAPHNRMPPPPPPRPQRGRRRAV